MGKKQRLLALLLGIVMLFGCFSFAGCDFLNPSTSGNNSSTAATTPAKVHSVVIRDSENQKIVGTLSVDLSMETVQLSARVIKEADADGTVTYESSNEEVATIAQDGKVTLKAEGETAITATAGDKKYEIVLIVSDSFASATKTYTVTVNGGTADILKAAEGEFVTLSAIIPDHKAFVKWNYSLAEGDAESLWISGHKFKMPACDVNITAEYVDKMYELNVIGAKVTADESENVQQGVDGGSSKARSNNKIYDITKYEYAYGTDISLEAVEAPAGMIFVGWDYAVMNNRVGDMGIDKLDFEMPGETLTVWAIFSNFSNKVVDAKVDSYTSKFIENGAVSGQAADPDLEGMCGCTMSIPASEMRRSDNPENIKNYKPFNTIETGSHTVKAIFKNHHESLSITVELFVQYYGDEASTGDVTIGPGEVKTVYFSAPLGLAGAPWWGFAVRENIGGSSDDIVQLDMVWGSAPTYPDGDPLFSVSGAAEFVELGNYTKHGWQRDANCYNAIGVSSFTGYGNTFDTPAACVAPITNLPEYNENDPYTIVYARVINNVNIGDHKGTYKIAVGFDADPRSSIDNTVVKEVVLEKVGDIVVVALKVPRYSATDQLYFSIIKEEKDSSSNSHTHNVSVLLTYNNVIGFEGEV